MTATVHFVGSESRAVNPPSLQILRINRKGMINDIIMRYSRKNLRPHDGRHAEKSHGRGEGGLTALEIQMGGGL